MRKIVVMKPHEWLTEASLKQSNSTAQAALESEAFFQGAKVIKHNYPIKVPIASTRVMVDELSDGMLEATSDGSFSSQTGHSYSIPIEFDNEEAEQAFIEQNAADVEGVFTDCEIGLFDTVCPTGAIGDHHDVLNHLNIQNLHAGGGRGQGVKIVVVDTGIDGTQINVAGGYNPRPGVSPGSAGPDHGTMVAFDALIAAPNAMIFDYALLQSSGTSWVGFLSDAIRAFAEIMVDHLQNPGPRVVINSWGMYDTDADAPVGNPQNYSRNPQHPFNQIVGALTGSGADVVFAAGNCGSTCPDNRCGANNRAPGNSIVGANSHPDVICVAAVTNDDDLLGYSSEGPGGLSAQTPDISGFSHFIGSGVFPFDSGTSAACPVVGGVVAALRSTSDLRNLNPAQMKARLLNSARSIHGTGWSPQYGWGIVDADSTM